MVKLIVIFCLMVFAIGSFSQENFIIDDGMMHLNEGGIEYYQKVLPNAVDITGSEYWPPLYKQTHWVCNQVASSYYMLTFENAKYNDFDASLVENQFAVYFPWNFGNGGSGWFGDHYVITMEMIKHLGVPLISESPADELLDSSIWLSGYDTYYNAMHNRIEDYYGINTSSLSGLLTLKAWVYDNGGSDYYGGTGTFLANFDDDGDAYFASDTPEEGAYVIKKCGNDALHARTICGYNDNVCFDYNGDGEYTNNVDLNGDGILDVRDYEKGGFKLAESNGPNWQGTGYCWMMYKCFADSYGNGGILNNTVHGIIPKVDYTPSLTAKIKLNHSSRERIKVKIGVSSDLSAETYEYITDFPILNYQGGDKYMQGGLTESDKIIEVGLDVTPLLEYFNEDFCGKVFLQVIEYDDSESYFGEIMEFAIIDYSGDSPSEYSYPSSVELINNSKTTIALDVCLNDLNSPKIVTEAVPELSESGTAWYDLEYEGGVAPFEWELLPFFEVVESTRTFDSFEGTKLTPDGIFDGDVVLELPFYFPFEKDSTNSIKISVDGYILPFTSTSVWTQFRENLNPFFVNEKVIAPLARFSLICDSNYGDGIFYEIAEDTVKIRWRCSDKGAISWTRGEFGCNLISGGTIEFTYQDYYLRKLFTNIGGISYGKQNDYIYCFVDDVPPRNSLITIKPYPIPQKLQVTETGVLFGELDEYENYPFRVRLSDANDISDIRTYSLSTSIDKINATESLFHVYPNPVLDELKVEFESLNNEIVQCLVYSEIGELLISKKVKSDQLNVINTSILTKGIYSVVIISGGKVFSRRFIKI